MDAKARKQLRKKAPAAWSREELEREAWFRGELLHLTKPGPQRDLYEEIHHSRLKGTGVPSPIVLNLHRRLGKTFLGVLLLVEDCLRSPRRINKFGAPSGSQAMDILNEHWNII